MRIENRWQGFRLTPRDRNNQSQGASENRNADRGMHGVGLSRGVERSTLRAAPTIGLSSLTSLLSNDRSSSTLNCTPPSPLQISKPADNHTLIRMPATGDSLPRSDPHVANCPPLE